MNINTAINGSFLNFSDTTTTLKCVSEPATCNFDIYKFLKYLLITTTINISEG